MERLDIEGAALREEKPLEPPARPELRAASASSGIIMEPDRMAAATRDAKGMETDIRASECASCCDLQATRETRETTLLREVEAWHGARTCLRDIILKRAG